MIRKICTLTLLLSLAACGSNEPAQEEASGEANDAPVVAAADTETMSGEAVFKKCVACHTIDKGGRSGLGPALHGVANRAIGSVEGFAYSNALKSKGGVWDDAALDGYIESPVKWAPGTRMSFAGIADGGERKALIEYLKEQK